jgi:hypothetical protein
MRSVELTPIAAKTTTRVHDRPDLTACGRFPVQNVQMAREKKKARIQISGFNTAPTHVWKHAYLRTHLFKLLMKNTRLLLGTEGMDVKL